MSPKLSIEVEPHRFSPGDAVSGRVDVVDGGRSRGIEVSLEYQERTTHFTEAELSVRPEIIHSGDLRDGDSHRFTLRLPADAPPGYSCAFGTMGWIVRAKSDEPGPDTVETTPVEVSVPPPDASAGGG